MKKIFTLLLIIIPFCGLCQEENDKEDNPYKYLKYEDGAVRFDAVYPLEGQSAESIKANILNYFVTKKNIVDVNTNESGILCMMDNYDLPHSYNRNAIISNAPPILGLPISGNVTILLKDDKYRVIITNLMLNKRNSTNFVTYDRGIYNNTEVETLVRKFNPDKGWATRKDKREAAKEFEDLLYDYFLIKSAENDDW